MTTVDKSTRLFSNFDPRYIPDCVLWLDGTDTSSNSMTITGGSNITTWKDKSTNAYAFAPVSGQVATLANYIGTDPRTVVYLSGTSKLVSTTNFVWRSNFTAFFVIYTSAGNFIYVQGAVSNYIFSGNNNLVYIDSNTFSVRDSVIGLGTPVISPNAWAMFVMGYNNGTSVTNYTVNGTSRASTTGTAVVDKTMSGTLYINGSASAVYDTTYVAEILHYNRNLSSTERQQVEGYLAWKWGLQTIVPSGHPYYTTIKHGPVLSTFRPFDVANCSLWLDAADGASITRSGSVVSQWKDKSGNSRNTTGIIATYNASGINGLSSLSAITDGTGPLANPGTANISVFVVGSVPSTSAVYFSALALNNSVKATASANYNASGNMFVSFYGGQPTQILYGGVSGTNLSLTYSETFATASIWEGVISGTSATTYGNGTSYGTTTGISGATFTYNAYWMGGPVTNTSWPGYMCEVVVYDRAVTDQERQTIEGYLSWKWGRVSGLPSTHPFKAKPPMKIT